MNIAEENRNQIKSQRERELDELRARGVAKTRRTKLKDLVATPMTTPEQAQQFLSAMRDRSKKEGWEHKPPTHLKGDGVDAWYMMQRQREQELRKKRKEAEQLLRGYRASYAKDDIWSPSKGRASLGDMMVSETLEDPAETEQRRKSTMPRLQHEWGDEQMMFEQVQQEQHMGRNPLGPERTSFLNDSRHFDGTQYTKLDDRNAFTNGVALFKDDGRQPAPEEREHFASDFDRMKFIDTSASQNRLRQRQAGDGRNLDTDNRMSGESGEVREGPETIISNESPPGTPIPETVWRDFISPEPGAKFPTEVGRYHLYASYACPGSHRALIVRALKGLQDVVSVTIVHPTWRHTNIHDEEDRHRGWVFGDPNGKPFHNTTGRGGPFPPAYPGNEPDPILNAYSVRDLYEYAQDTSGKYTIPLLWDKKTHTIVNNESSDISYMLNSCFNDYSSNPDLDLYTEDDEDGLDKLNEVSQWLYPMMIHGVYRCGFAKNQKAYDHAIDELTDAFDMADELLSAQRYLTGDTLTDADIRLFVTLLRFDEVYAFYFRANTRLVMLTPSLLNFCREIYQMPGVAETCHMDQIKAHFFGSHAEWNKYSVIPRGLGFMDLLEQPHDRDQFDDF